LHQTKLIRGKIWGATFNTPGRRKVGSSEIQLGLGQGSRKYRPGVTAELTTDEVYQWRAK